MAGYADDLRFAQQAGKCIEIVVAGQSYVTGVYDVNEEEGHFTLFTPKTAGDDTTRARFLLRDVVAMSVTDVDWEPSL